MPLKCPEPLCCSRVSSRYTLSAGPYGTVPAEKLDVVSDDIAESSPLSGLGTGDA